MMNTLTLCRRHTKSCVKGYAQGQRHYRPQTPKEIKADCACPLVVSGSLVNVPGRIRDVSTEVNTWDQAEAITTRWQAWGQFTDPNPTVVEDPTIDEATAKFLIVAETSRKLEPTTIQDFDQHFRLRLAPFCAGRKVTHVRFFENASLVQDCVTSWRSVKDGKPLGSETQRAELERFRGFLTFCVESGWLKVNHAKAKVLSVKKDPTKKKFGWTPEEDARVFDAINRIVDCYGRTGELNAQETRAFCLVLRHTGLRISDVTRLESSQIVPRASGKGWAVQIMEMKKTKDWVRVPIPDEVHEALSALPFKDGAKHWFYTGVGTLKTSIKTWRKRITKLIKLAQTDTGGQAQPFKHPSSPHTFRHTFAISHLNAGADVKMVSRWLGHGSVAITEKHYSHANEATNLASEAAYDASMARQAARSDKKTGGKVVTFRQRNSA